MKRVKLISIVLSLFFFTNCEKTETVESDTIKIRTGKANYLVNSEIDLTLINNTSSAAKHFICDNSNLAPTWIVEYDNNSWNEIEFPLLCTAMGPAGFYGILDVSEIKHDTVTLSINETGKFKLRYRFVIGNDTLDFDSNEFTVSGLEL